MPDFVWTIIGQGSLIALIVLYVIYRRQRASAQADSLGCFDSPEQERVFLDLVRSHFSEQGTPVEIRGGVLLPTSGSRAGHEYGLMNLAQACCQSDPGEWQGIIARHFQASEQADREQEQLLAEIHDFSRVRDLLMVSIADRADMPPEANFVCREDIPGTVSYLSLDLPTSVRSVKPEECGPWGRSPSELFEIALANVQRNCRPDVERMDVTDQFSCTAILGESFFVAAHALFLDQYPGCIGREGALVAIPTRHLVLCYPINGMDVVTAIDLMGMLATSRAAEGPGTITDRLYWYHGGRFTDLPYRITKKAFEFHPPTEFLDMMGRLPQQPSPR